MNYDNVGEIYESTRIYYINIKSNMTQERIDGIYTIIMNALNFKMDDVVYKMIIDWKWIDTLCIFSSDDRLIEILNQSKKYRDFVVHYKNFNESKEYNFIVYDNIRDIYDIHEKYHIIDLFEP
jgi:hypothetical protein